MQPLEPGAPEQRQNPGFAGLMKNHYKNIQTGGGGTPQKFEEMTKVMG